MFTIKEINPRLEKKRWQCYTHISSTKLHKQTQKQLFKIMLANLLYL